MNEINSFRLAQGPDYNIKVQERNVGPFDPANSILTSFFFNFVIYYFQFHE